MNRKFVSLAVLLMISSSSGLFAQGLTNVEVSSDAITATIALPGGISADLEIVFEDALGLSLQSLGLSAELVNPGDPGLLARLPDPQKISIASAFPVLVRIDPPSYGPLSFRGNATVNLHTHNLSFTANCPLRLFKAPAGGQFFDITETMGMGSYRTGGSTGGFSEFLIAADLRLIDPVIVGKFDRLQELLDATAALIPESVQLQLQDRLDAARGAYAGGATLAAIQEIEALAGEVRQYSGTYIPDVWRSARDLANVAGELRSAAATLRFSLNLKANSGL